MPRKLRPKPRRQRRAVAPLTQARWTARSHLCKRSKRNAKSCQGRRSRRNTACRVVIPQQAVDTSSTSCRTYKNSEELRSRIVSGIITPIHERWNKASASSPHRELPPATPEEVDPLRIYPQRPQHPQTSRQPSWRDPLGPFAVGGEDLDPFGYRRGGMIVDPLRSGFPRVPIDPSSGLPNRLPPGAVPPGARFDPFGPIGTSPPGPRPDRRGQ
ncbi:proteasome inhibitor subunit 1 [Phyllostomus discolor]|uniref:Proteasome inhibitor subunit 1 n=1 Tax=Phyllostomus discolor TaxID=89673 RepID=A0A833ZCB3_9CHIR|nr:proteasome inhibitor subunit 1 [Phyllostomus discolor]